MTLQARELAPGMSHPWPALRATTPARAVGAVQPRTRREFAPCSARATATATHCADSAHARAG
eukprot:6173215-Pleurochrysis_carterae.AAC.3